jgi:hypothetical protein
MRRPILALIFTAFSLAWLVFFGAGSRIPDWDATLLLLGATALFYWTFRTGQTPPRLPLWHTAALWALPVYAIFQLIPLPPAVLEALSPARAMIAGSLNGVLPSSPNAPISVVPPLAVAGLFSLLGYLTTFSLLRDMGWRFVETSPWLPVAPVAGIASIEAAIGIWQWLSGSHFNAPVTGTFSNREHFAGMLEIALPFTLVFGFISFRRHQAHESASQKPATLAAGAWTASLLLLLALRQSGSAAAGAVVTASSFILLSLIIVPRLKTRKLRRSGAGVAAGAAIVALLLVAPPPLFIDSLARMGEPGRPEVRLSLWGNSAALLSEFRWFGTGSGGFEPTFLKYAGSSELKRTTNPDNDVLHLLITFGTVGFCIVLIGVAGVLRPALVGAVFLIDEPRRLLAAATTASLLGVLLRSSLHASLSVPAIAMAFAWVAGLSQSSGLE